MGGGPLAFTFLDPLCRRLCHELEAVVVNLDYRLAPEHRYPAQRDHGLAAMAALRSEGDSLDIDPARIGVLGFSSGGHLAASVAQHARSGLRAQALVMPVLDVGSSQPSAQADPVWRETAVRLRQLYFGTDADLTDPGVSPIFEPSLAGVAPALVLTAEHDPLRDDGRAYACRLAQAGVTVRHQEFPATHVAATDAVQQQMDEAIIAALKEML
jgi:acetyl esterase